MLHIKICDVIAVRCNAKIKDFSQITMFLSRENHLLFMRTRKTIEERGRKRHASLCACKSNEKFSVISYDGIATYRTCSYLSCAFLPAKSSFIVRKKGVKMLKMRKKLKKTIIFVEKYIVIKKKVRYLHLQKMRVSFICLFFRRFTRFLRQVNKLCDLKK
ncbi:MAG: hypothetical protein J5629_10240 [Muribaculaceae bacterium]|nr:hypothetical protein [Muribaculaceae bacterium]